MNEKFIIFFAGMVIGNIVLWLLLCIINRINPLYLMMDRLTGLVLWLTGVIKRTRICDVCDKKLTKDKFCWQDTWPGVCTECRDDWITKGDKK